MTRHDLFNVMIPSFWEQRGYWIKFLDQRIYCSRPRSSGCPSCSISTRPCHFQPCQLNCPHCRCYTRESRCLWSPTYHDALSERLASWLVSWKPPHLTLSWPSLVDTVVPRSFLFSHYPHAAKLSLEIWPTRASHSVWWGWSRESQGWSWKCNPIYGVRWCQIHQLPPSRIERRERRHHTHLC